MAGWDDEAQRERNIRRSRESWTAMQPFCEGAAYVNDLGEEGEQRVREAYGQNYEHLLAVKRKYDPTNFFQVNQNIWPATPTGHGVGQGGPTLRKVSVSGKQLHRGIFRYTRTGRTPATQTTPPRSVNLAASGPQQI